MTINDNQTRKRRSEARSDDDHNQPTTREMFELYYDL